MLNEKLRPVIEPFTSAAGRLIARAHVSPNALTTLGLLGVVASSWLIVAGRSFLAGLLLIPAFLIDVFDGALARATGRVTVWGGFFDSVSDRVADAVLFAAFAWALRGEPRALAAALVAGSATMLVPYARAKAEALGFRAPGGLGERAERAILVCAGLILGYEEIALWLIGATTLATFVVRVSSVRSQAARS